MQRRPQYLQNTVNVSPPCHISSAYGNPLEDEILQDIASAFAGLDVELLGVLEVVLNDAARGGVSLAAETQRAMPKDRDMISGLLVQFGGITAGKYRFHEHYLRDNFMLSIWGRASNVLSKMLDMDLDDPKKKPLLDGIKNLFRVLELAAAPLAERLPAAAARGVLEPDDRAVIRLRLIKLDEMFDMYHRQTSMTRTMKTWPEIRNLIDGSNSSVPERTQGHSFNRLATFTLWSTIATTTLISLPTLYQAYHYSPHQPGTTKDADFWLLIQSSSMQFLSLVAASVSIHNNHHLSTYTQRWLFAMLTVGFLCVIGAMILYTQAPTEWSAMVNCIGGIVQAFVFVQVLFERKEKRE